MTWEMFISYASDSVFVYLFVGVILSYGADLFPEFSQLPPRWARLAFFGLCLAVPLVMTALGILTGVNGQWGDMASTWWPALYAGMTAFGSGTLAHIRALKKPAPPAVVEASAGGPGQWGPPA